MPYKIFINYRRDDDPNGAARVRDGLVTKFGKANVFMDVDNLLAGQRFDEELAKALSQCDVLITIMGSRWMEQLKSRAVDSERDYVREEIAATLSNKLTVIPVRVGRDGRLTPLPRRDDLPEDIRDLVLHQKHDVTHERFGRDIAELVEAITFIRRSNRPPYVAPRVPWGWVAATAVGLIGITAAGAHFIGLPMPWTAGSVIDPGVVVRAQKRATELAAEVRLEQEARGKAEAEAQRLADLVAQEHRNREARESSSETKRKTADARQTLQPGQTFRDCSDGCPEMVVVPAGNYWMGSPGTEAKRRDDETLRPVVFNQPFAVGVFEVTSQEWKRCVASGECRSSGDSNGWWDQLWGRARPVTNVSWVDAQKYVA